MTARLPIERLPDWPRCMTREVAAAYLGISPSQFDAEVRAGIWPAGLWEGRRIRWDRQEIDAWLDARLTATLPAGQASDRRRRWAGST